MPKIAIVSPYPLETTGGVQRHILDFYDYLKSKGYYVKLISPSKKFKHPDHIRVGTYYKVETAILTNSSTSYYPRTKLFSSKTKLEEEFDIIHVHEPMLIPPFFYGYQIMRHNKAKYIAHIHAHNAIFEEQELVVNPIIKRIMSNFNAILASSKVSAKPYEVLGKGVHIVPNGVSLSKINPSVKKAEEYLDGKKNTMFIGRFDERKGLRYLLQSWTTLIAEFQDNIRLIIAGGGSEESEKEILELVENLPYNENIIFEGPVSEERKATLYATADLLVSPAISGESFGMVLTEAMAAGTPVIGFDNPGYRTVLEAKEKYCIARLYDILDLSKKITGILNNPVLHKELSDWGLNEVRTKYDWNIVSKNILTIYDDVLADDTFNYDESENESLFDTNIKLNTDELFSKIKELLT